MPDFDYLIVGGGMTSAAAARGIREVDAAGKIGILGAESHKPYARPPLSKALWTQGKPEESVWLDLPQGLELLPGRRAVSIEGKAHVVRDDRGDTHRYRKLLLATGGSPRQLPFGKDVIYFRTLDDYRNLRKIGGDRVAVIGGGFIGSEIASALAQNGKKVTMVFPEDGVCARAFPNDLTAFVTDYYREKGVDVRARESVSGIEGAAVVTRTGRIEADAIVAGIGIVPAIDLARQAGLTVSDGVDVNDALQTSDPDIYAAGDVANFANPALGRRIRVEHEDNANTMGAAAGRSMAGARVRYDHLPFFYSDLFDLGYEAVGEIDARHRTVADWKTPFREGVVYYLDRDRVRGVLLWNTWGQVDNARALIAEARAPADLKGRLPR
ncbi:MAG: NAD(P)/FAD-dependent oxidoreductase [Myxococcales bacterium]|nr:NAD(P)/FAD-dependent oxidoreductase [Myxococcales bacterium]